MPLYIKKNSKYKMIANVFFIVFRLIWYQLFLYIPLHQVQAVDNAFIFSNCIDDHELNIVNEYGRNSKYKVAVQIHKATIIEKYKPHIKYIVCQKMDCFDCHVFLCSVYFLFAFVCLCIYICILAQLFGCGDVYYIKRYYYKCITTFNKVFDVVLYSWQCLRNSMSRNQLNV